MPAERDPVELLASQHPSRLQDLVPIRVGRMASSPFAFFRGAAALMANDLAGDLRTGHHVVICGDAHVANFGFFASPERRLLFDLNDFDEASIGPWEWDVKRLAASVVLAGRAVGLSDDTCRESVVRCVSEYQDQIAGLAQLSPLQRFYLSIDAERLVARADPTEAAVLRRSMRKARRRTSEGLAGQVVTGADGARTIAERPPVAVHVDHLGPRAMTDLFADYRATLRADASLALAQFRPVDHVRRAVGVGSVGTRCYLVLLEAPSGELLFLQVKEALPSVVQTYGRIPLAVPAGLATTSAAHAGFRVVTGQHVLQAQSDPFLGWLDVPGKVVGRTGRFDFYWRQFRDMKGSIDLDALDAPLLTSYARLCGAVLARAHAQSPGPDALAGYLGSSRAFAEALGGWATAYADQAERDHAAWLAAIERGRLPAERDV